MNAEYLLDAIGRLDDDLVRDAENYRRPRARYRPLLSWAACFAVMLLLGYGATHFGMGGGAAPSFSGGGNGGGAPASGNSAPSAAEDGNPGETAEPDTPQGAASIPPGGGNAEAPGESQEAPRGTVFVRDGTYILSGEVLAELPEGGEPVLLGTLSALYPDSLSPYTDVEKYVGLNLWAESGRADILYTIYVELPAGGFARAELVEP